MRIQSFEDMLLEYGDAGLDKDDKEERIKLLSEHKYSIIIEGGYMEFDNLDKWIELHILENTIKELWYGKIGYDYLFKEFFLNNEESFLKLGEAIPNIYTIYPNSYPAGLICKSVGYSKDEIYEPTNLNAILFR